MALTGWTVEEIQRFLRMQFELQHEQYQANYPGARFDVILADGVPAGRLYVHQRPSEIRIIDIALLPEFRRQGIGGHLLRSLLEEADGKAITASLHVEHDNPILDFYERLGFRKGRLNGIYYYMERPAAVLDAGPEGS